MKALSVLFLLFISIYSSLVNAESKRIECLSADKLISLTIQDIIYQLENPDGTTTFFGMGINYTLKAGNDKITYGSIKDPIFKKHYGNSYEVQVLASTKGLKTILQITKIDTSNRSGNFELGEDMLTLTEMPVSDLEKKNNIENIFNFTGYYPGQPKNFITSTELFCSKTQSAE